ncbi:hypothetical protein VYU27_004251 [Nannochloropsis oceanica]
MDHLGWNRAIQAGLSPAVLALDVLRNKNGVVEMVEVARITGMPFSTLVNDPSQLQKGKGDTEVFTNPGGAQFVKSKLRHGIMPSLLVDLLGARHHAQRKMRDPGATEGEKRVLDARQKAFKGTLW